MNASIKDLIFTEGCSFARITTLEVLHETSYPRREEPLINQKELKLKSNNILQ